MIKKMIKKKVLWSASLLLLVVALSFVGAWSLSYYNPNSTIVDGWDSTGSPSHSQISDSARYPNVPNTNTFVDTRMDSGVTSEFGFSNVTDGFVENITLWVYASTGNTAEFTFYLRQGSTNRCSSFVAGNSPAGWFSCTWSNPSGSFDDLRLLLGTVGRAAGGQPTNAFVYAAYLEVNPGPLPPVVTLLSPEVDNIILNSPVDLDFRVVDDYYSNISSCSLYSNFSGSWVEIDELLDVSNNTVSSFSVSESDGFYSWNILCENAFGRMSFAPENFTFFFNSEPPSFQNSALNETIINQGDSIRFNVSVADYFGIDTARVTIKYPGGSESTFVLSNSGDEYYYVFSNTLSAGIYEVVSVWANDTLGKSGSFNPELSFEVESVIPGFFNLISPSNNTESKNVSPLFSWGETSPDNFDNYTLYVSLSSDLSSPIFVESTSSVSSTETLLSSNLNSDETYFWGVSAFNTFGNNVSSAVFRYVTDNTPPNIVLDTSHFSYSNTSFNTFLFTPTDANTLNYCELFANSSGSWVAVNTTSSINNGLQNSLGASLVEGFNSWNVRCFDEANNSAFAINNRTFVVDLSPPIVELISPVDESGSNIITFSYFVNESLSGIESCSLIINESVVDTSFSVNNKEVNSFSRFLSNDNYSWRVSCVDGVGWVGSSDTWSLEVEAVDIDPPVVSLISPINNKYLNSSSVLFEYRVEGVSEISNCSLFINGNINSTSFGVARFQTVNFSVSGFVGDSFNWSVQCFDSEAEPQSGVSITRNFFVDLTDPVVNLNTPANDVWLTNNNINFNFFTFDNNLDSCALYTNETGIFEQRQTLSNPVNNDNNTISGALNNGIFSWNIYCIDLSNRRGFNSENFIIKVDSVSPWFENVNVSPLSPAVYSLGEVHNFSVSWFDNFALDSVVFEHNFSGSFVEESPSSNGDIFWFGSVLDAGTYSFRWSANDSAGNNNSTGFVSYVVSKDFADINLFLNSIEDNLTIDEDTIVNLTAQVSKPEGGNISLLVNNNVLVSGISVVSFDYWFENPGLYNVSVVFNETKNFFKTTKNFSVNVLDVTPPVVTLLSPFNDSTQPTGPLLLGYSVSDFSDVSYCALYVNDEFEQNETSVVKDTAMTFEFIAEEGEYSWRVECRDSFGNLGVSETRFFESVSIEEMKVSVSTALSEYEQGESISVNVSVVDIFDNPLVANVNAGVILGESVVPWWNPSWSKRKNIVLNETNSEDVVSGVAEVNVSNIDISSCNELRIIRHVGGDVEEVLFLVEDSGADWCDVLFEVNVDSDATNYEYFAYYSNPSASAPLNSLSLFESILFNAQQSGSDGGTVQNVGNIIGKNDDSFAGLRVTGGGRSSTWAHGRAFVNSIPKGSIDKVEVRYRYAVSDINNLEIWRLMYSVDEGSSYNELLNGTGASGRVTSAWFDVTSAYSSLTWSGINNTRLQSEVTKSGGGGSAGFDFYWVEMNVTYEKDILVSDTAVLDEEVLVFNSSGSTNIGGRFDFVWNTQDVNPGNYSVFAWTSRVDFVNASNYSFVVLTPDVTPPVVNLTAPESDSFVEKGVVNFVYDAFDNNLDRCTLYLGEQDLVENVTDFNVVNGENSFSVSLDYEEYIWNVRCFDKENNNAFSNFNFSFVVFVPDPVLSTELVNADSFVVSWDELSDASFYNVYVTDDLNVGFDESPNFVLSEDEFYEFDVSGNDTFFVKVTAVSNNRESEVGSVGGVYSHSLMKGFNTFSVPFFVDDYSLFDGSSGLKFVSDSDCLLALWKYDSSSGTFKSADWVSDRFVPSFGSEDFTELNPLLGYYVETSDSCNVKFGGVVPANNESISLVSGQNLVPWLSGKTKTLSTAPESGVIVTNPENALHSIAYSVNKSGSLSFHVSVNYPEGWHPALELSPLRGYFFKSNVNSIWLHSPLGG